MTIDQKRAMRKLIALHGRAEVMKYLPLVSRQGFIAICETSSGDQVEVVNHESGWEGLEITPAPKAPGEWKPKFTQKELWEAAAGYQRKSGPAKVTIMSSKYPGKVAVDSGAQAGSFIARLIAARLHGRVHISSDGTKTTDEELLWGASKE